MSAGLCHGIVTVRFFDVRLALGDPMHIHLEETRQRQVDPEVI